jgi:hypothetical protein
VRCVSRARSRTARTLVPPRTPLAARDRQLQGAARGCADHRARAPACASRRRRRGARRDARNRARLALCRWRSRARPMARARRARRRAGRGHVRLRPCAVSRMGLRLAPPIEVREACRSAANRLAASVLGGRRRAYQRPRGVRRKIRTLASLDARTADRETRTAPDFDFLSRSGSRPSHPVAAASMSRCPSCAPSVSNTAASLHPRRDGLLPALVA